MVVKRYTNPFGKFNWMLRNIPQFARTVIVSGLEMLRTMGMSRDILSDEMLEIMERAEEGKPFFIEKNPDYSWIRNVIVTLSSFS